MKSLVFRTVLIFVLAFCIVGCSSESESDQGTGNSDSEEEIDVEGVSIYRVEEVEEDPPVKSTTMATGEFESLLSKLPLTVDSTTYHVQDDRYKALYPDMLQAVIKNNSSLDIKNAIVAFVAWDENNLPVKIVGSIDFSDGAYVRKVNYSDINLVPGDTYGENSGFEIDESCGIKSFKAIVVSYEAFNGEEWNNPYYDEWLDLYEGAKYAEDLSVEVIIEDELVDDKVVENQSPTVDVELSEQNLISIIDSQEVKIISTTYHVQDDRYKALYPDMLQAVIKNNSSLDIKNAIVAFVAWDENNLPVKIVGSIDFSDGAYVRKVNYSDINLVPGDTYGENSGFEIDESCGIKSFKAIVVSYEAFNGEEWNNPYYDEWLDLYEGAKLL